MAEIKTKQTEVDVFEFINSFANSEQKRNDSYELIKLMQEFTGFEPKMWGPSIIGFGLIITNLIEVNKKAIGR